MSKYVGFKCEYTDKKTNAYYPDAWINLITLNYSPYTQCRVLANAFVNEESFLKNMDCIHYDVIPYIVVYGSTDWKKYFDESILNEQGIDLQSQCLKWAKEKMGVEDEK